MVKMISEKKLIEICYKRILREHTKFFGETRGIPTVYLIGYKTAISDVLFDLDKETWRKFVVNQEAELKRFSNQEQAEYKRRSK